MKRTERCQVEGIKRSSWGRRWEKTAKIFCFWVEAFFFWLNSGKSGSTERGEGGRQQHLTGLTLHPLFALALLFVLLLEFGYQARVHIPGLNGTLLVLLYTGGTKPDRDAVEELSCLRPKRPVLRSKFITNPRYLLSGFSKPQSTIAFTLRLIVRRWLSTPSVNPGFPNLAVSVHIKEAHTCTSLLAAERCILTNEEQTIKLEKKGKKLNT